MRTTRNWIAMLGVLALLTLVLRATPPRLSVSNHRDAAIEGAVPGSRVTLFDGATPIGSAAVDQSGRAGFGELHLSPGDHVLRVAEWGTGWGVGDPLTIHVSSDAPRVKGSIPTTIALSSSANPSYFGQPLTLWTIVTPSSATGAVTFYDGTTVLGITTLTAGIASLTTTMPAFGTRPFKAYYAGSPVYAPSTSPSLSQTISVLAQNGVEQAVNFSSNRPSSSIAVGDFNGDGLPDLAVVNPDTPSAVAIWLAIPNPPPSAARPASVSFRPPVGYATGLGSNFAAVGDFNGDGKPDLVVANGTSNNASVLLGNGDGTFQQAVNYATGTNPNWVALADLTATGRWISPSPIWASSTISVLLGNGDGTFRCVRDLSHRDRFFELSETYRSSRF